jgi:hypothetical protein
MEISDIVKATFKSRSKRELDFLIQTLSKALGKQNIKYLSPTYIVRARIFILDMDINIPNSLLRYDFKESDKP